MDCVILGAMPVFVSLYPWSRWCCFGAYFSRIKYFSPSGIVSTNIFFSYSNIIAMVYQQVQLFKPDWNFWYCKYIQKFHHKINIVLGYISFFSNTDEVLVEDFVHSNLYVKIYGPWYANIFHIELNNQQYLSPVSLKW